MFASTRQHCLLNSVGRGVEAIETFDEQAWLERKTRRSEIILENIKGCLLSDSFDPKITGFDDICVIITHEPDWCQQRRAQNVPRMSNLERSIQTNTQSKLTRKLFKGKSTEKTETVWSILSGS